MAKAAKARSSEIQEYLSTISSYEREFKKWEGRVERIVKRYRDEDRPANKTQTGRFNILWSNVQTLVPATFSRLPQPDVSRRFRDNDPVGRVAALILERALDFEIQHYADYRASLRQCVFDRFLGGRGTCWARYEPHFRQAEERGLPEDGAQITEDTDEAPVNEALDYECAPIDYVHSKDFGHDVSRTWEEVTCVWRKVYMSEEAVSERFGADIAKKLAYDSTPEELKRGAGNKTGEEGQKKQACVIELWDKTKGSAFWFSKSYPEMLDEREDPLGLQEFFPCPRPLYSTLTNESLIPVPDFSLYQDQAKALDVLADRINGLCDMLQLKGVYDASADPAIARLFTEGNNGSLLPVKNWAGFAEKNGLKGQVDVYDLTPLVQALNVAIEAVKEQKEQVYEITGISDIIRGQTAASETATAQQIKGQYASLRLKAMQDEVAQFATDLLRLKGQIICSKFAPQTIGAIAAVEQLSEEDQKRVPEAMALLIGQERMMSPEAESPNPLRAFRIDVAADTLVQIDEQREKTDRMEFLTANGAFMEKATQMMAQAGAAAPILIGPVMELWKYGITAYKVGKNIEGTLDQAADQLKKMAQQPQPPKPDPEMAKVEAQKAKDAASLQHDQAVAQQQGQLEVMRIQMESAARQRELQMESTIEQHKNQMEAARAQQEAMLNIQFERFKELLGAKTKVEVAEISAGATLDAAQIRAAKQGAE